MASTAPKPWPTITISSALLSRTASATSPANSSNRSLQSRRLPLTNWSMEAASSHRCSNPVIGSLSQSREAKPPTPVTPPTIFATSAGAPSAATRFMHRMPTNEPSNSHAVISNIGKKATSAKRQFVRSMRPKAPLRSAIPVVR